MPLALSSTDDDAEVIPSLSQAESSFRGILMTGINHS